MNGMSDMKDVKDMNNEEKPVMKYELRDSDIHGKGVFATKHIKEGELIGVPLSIKYGFYIHITDDLGKWINHGWYANTKLVKDPKKNEWGLFATSDINKGTELKMDYRETPWFIAKPSIWYK
jgi:SET domain-containing protein